MNDTIVYRPHKTEIWELFLVLPMEIFAFVVAGCFLPVSIIGFLCSIGVGITCIWLTKEIYDSIKKAIIFEQNGLRIIGSSFLDYHYVPWEKLTYRYYIRNYRGHLFLLLSPNVLNFKEAKRFANKGVFSSRIFIDCVVVIHLGIQDKTQIKELIAAHLVQIDTF